MKPIIRVENVSKQFHIGARQVGYTTFREAISTSLRAPLMRLRRGGCTSDATIWALKDIEFEVMPGEVLGIIGHNGAGKSTLLKILSRITEPTTGEIDLYGRVGSLLEVGTGFHPELTGRENIFLNGAILGMKRFDIRARFDEIVAFAEVEKFIDTPVKHYSSGMYLRLAFAIAAHLEPEILIVDEVLAVGDAAFQKKCLGKMQNIAGQGRTVLFVSHNIPAIVRLCSKAILLSEGRLIQQGTAEGVSNAYLNGTTEAGGLKKWDAEKRPGTDELSLISVMLRNESGAAITICEVQESLQLHIKYRVRIPNLRFRCAAVFYTQGVCAFASIELEEEVRRASGDYLSILTIPANLFAEGEYSIGIAIVTAKGGDYHYVNEGGVINFVIFDSVKGTSARGDYAQHFPGVMRPLLRWQMSQEASITDA